MFILNKYKTRIKVEILTSLEKRWEKMKRIEGHAAISMLLCLYVMTGLQVNIPSFFFCEPEKETISQKKRKHKITNEPPCKYSSLTPNNIEFSTLEELGFPI